MTRRQTGASITVNITARDIKTLAVIKSEQRQFTPETIWNTAPTYVNNVPYGSGLPSWLPAWAASLSSGICTEYAMQQKALQERLAKEEAERQAQLAKQEEERKAEEVRRYRASYPITGYWKFGDYPDTQPTTSWRTWYTLTFNTDGTVTGYRDYWSGERVWSSSKGEHETDGLKYHNEIRYNGTYTREGTTIKITWSTVETTKTRWVMETNWLTNNSKWEKQSSTKTTASNSADSCSLDFSSNNPVRIYWQGCSLSKN
jgi:hypothetical protein